MNRKEEKKSQKSYKKKRINERKKEKSLLVVNIDKMYLLGEKTGREKEKEKKRN